MTAIKTKQFSGTATSSVAASTKKAPKKKINEQKKKKHQDDDSNDYEKYSDGSVTEEEEEYEEEMSMDSTADSSFEEEDPSSTDSSSSHKFDQKKYYKLLSKLFPSKYMSRKLENLEKKEKKETAPVVATPTESGKKKQVTSSKKEPSIPTTSKHNLRKRKEASTEESEEVPKKKVTANSPSNKTGGSSSKKKKEQEYVPPSSEEETASKTESHNETGSESEYETCEDSDEEDGDEDFSKHKSKKYNIVFTIGVPNSGIKKGDYTIDHYDEYEDDDYNEDEDSDYTYEDDDSEEEEEEESEKSESVDSRDEEEETKKKKTEKENLETENPEKEEEVILQLKSITSKLKETHGNSTLLKELLKIEKEKMETIKKEKEKRQLKDKKKNVKEFSKLLDDKQTNEYSFFRKMELEQQNILLKELAEVNKLIHHTKPYVMSILESSIPMKYKSTVLKKIKTLRYMEPGDSEYYKIKNWVDTFMQIPFDKYSQLDVSINDGVDKCHEFMENAKQILDKAVYGMNDAKMQIMQMVGLWITNPNAVGTAIAIHGPMGTGKTSIVKEGISKILGRNFEFIALGGATDSSFLEGHSYTYEGSTWGKIVQTIINSKCMNPVIYFDELDKISDTPKGEEIAGILMHLTDTTQNSMFHDKYFSEIDFDLSKCLFIFSYNDESKVNPILKDRMYRISTKGYDMKQKYIISNQYLLPNIREQVKFDSSDIIIPDETIKYIVDEYTSKEEGVRNLKRCFEIIYTKLNLYRLMKSGTNIFEEDMKLKVTFPLKVTVDIVQKLVKMDKKEENPSLKFLYL